MTRKTATIAAAAFAALSTANAAERPDWLLDPSPYKAQVRRTPDAVVLDNGLLTRTITTKPGTATTSFKCTATGEEFVRAVSPEARVGIDGREYLVGGMSGQPVLNYILEGWTGKMDATPGAYTLCGVEEGPIDARFGWKRRQEWLARNPAWPPKGRHLVMHYAPPAAGEGAGDIFPEAVAALDFRGKWDGSWREVLSNGKGKERVSCMNEGKFGEIMAAPEDHAFLERDWPEDAECVAATVDCGDDAGSRNSMGVELIVKNPDGRHQSFRMVLSPARNMFQSIVDGGEYQRTAGFDKTKRAEVRIGRRHGDWFAWGFQDGKEVVRMALPVEGKPVKCRVGKVCGSGGRALKRMHIYAASLRKAGEGAAKAVSSSDLPAVDVHYEIYDGVPVVSKWVTVSNSTGKAVTVDTFVAEELRLTETSGQYDIERFPQMHNLHIESNFGYREGEFFRGQNAAAVHYVEDPAYSTQENWGFKGIHTVRCNPPLGPAERLEPGATFESFRLWEVVFDTSERERRTLAIRRMYRVVAPWTCENPLMFHKTTARENDIREAVRQCKETGFELVIMSFGSGFNLESTEKAYRERYHKLAREAAAQGVAIGGYSLTSSRGAGDPRDNVRCPNPAFGRGPCLASKWGRSYLETLKSFMKEAEFGVFENDGPYPGDTCEATNHAYHAGKADSVWKQWRAQGDLYRFCRENGIYVNQPDGYFMEGGSKSAGGYREANWSLPRDYQLVIERQNVYDNNWTRNTSMHWMFVPLTQYHGGGKAATIEPLSEHLDHYSARFANLLGCGAQACWRGPRLYDTPETLAMVRKWVAFYKENRRILDGDMIHLRRPDGRDWDGWLMIDPDPGKGLRGIASLFNPTAKPLKRDVTLPLYYTGAKGKAKIAVGDGAEAKTYALDALGKATVAVEIPANGWLHVFVSTAD